MKKALLLSALATVMLAGCGSPELDNSTASSSNDAQSSELRPNGKGTIHGDKGEASRKPGAGNGISYHGGPVILGTTNVHYIWYGNWATRTNDQAILTNLAQSIGGSPYFNINTTYYNGSSVKVSNSVALTSSANDNYSRGTALADADIQAIVAAQNPTDTNGVYFVLTTPDVNETSGFCTQYCGWHTHGAINGLDIKYSFVGDPERCPAACTNGTPAPNGSVGADGMASIISHELEETVTDPDLNAWYDTRGAENADKCAWTFGTTYSNGAGTANMNLGGRDYLIQQNWVNAAGGYCAKSY